MLLTIALLKFNLARAQGRSGDALFSDLLAKFAGPPTTEEPGRRWETMRL